MKKKFDDELLKVGIGSLEYSSQHFAHLKKWLERILEQKQSADRELKRLESDSGTCDADGVEVKRREAENLLKRLEYSYDSLRFEYTEEVVGMAAKVSLTTDFHPVLRDMYMFDRKGYKEAVRKLGFALPKR